MENTGCRDLSMVCLLGLGVASLVFLIARILAKLVSGIDWDEWR